MEYYDKNGQALISLGEELQVKAKEEDIEVIDSLESLSEEEEFINSTPEKEIENSP